MDATKSISPDGEQSPPDYVFALIQVSIQSAAHNVPALLAAVEKARADGADNRQILRAMFRSDDAFAAGIESAEFLRVAESLQAGQLPQTFA